MKSKPSKPPMPLYRVSIANESFDTHASDTGAAISKSAYRYAAKMGLSVKLVQYRIREGELVVDVHELT